MPCRHLELPGGGTAIVCTRGRTPVRRCSCGRPAEYLCDGPSSTRGTCDRPMCERCRTNVGPDRDLCPACAEAPRQVALL